MQRWVPLAVAFALALSAVSVAAPEEKADNADVRAVASAGNEFAFDLYARLREKDGNLLFSPTSLSIALAMTSGGAAGDTAAEMAKTLHFPFTGERLHAAEGELLRSLMASGSARGQKLTLVNTLWGQKGYPFKEAFLTSSDKHYGAGLRLVDFRTNAEAARQEINRRIEKDTNDKIKDLLPEGSVDSLTRMVLTNAIYFKGSWESQFKKDRTREGTFHVAAGKTVKAPFMSQVHSFGYFADDAVQVVELPYVGKQQSMLLIVPRKETTLAAVEKGLNRDRLNEWVGGLQREEVDLAMPRFKTTADFTLKPVLTALGMGRAFSEQADFSAMNGGDEKLQLTDVIHKAYAEVNEEGTEAAAATGVVVGVRSVPVRKEVRADRPFLYLIRDRQSGAILFLGRMIDPTR